MRRFLEPVTSIRKMYAPVINGTFLVLLVQICTYSTSGNGTTNGKLILPTARKFLPLIQQKPLVDAKLCVLQKLRILQFNMLADGLSGLRDDLGAFSRVCHDDIRWERRRGQILHEILQYDPDIITMQECDHYYDCFLPLLMDRGYDGIFAPKPASACLEVSDNSDGCAIFLRRDKLLATSVEVRPSGFRRLLILY